MVKGRPSKSAKLIHENGQTKAEIKARAQVEDSLRGNDEVIKPSGRLNSNQKKIFNYIVNELKAIDFLGNLDSFLLETCCIAIDRLQQIEKDINRDFELIKDRQLMSAKEKYTKDFFKCSHLLSMSPESRAKFGILALNQKIEEKDPLLKILKREAN
jgi:P27 family predicted phage terminase small subunit